MTRKERLVESFNEAIEIGALYVFTEINLGTDYPSSELIVNPIENAEEKLKYLCKTYDNELKHPHAPIGIITFGYFNNMSQLEYIRANFKELN